MKRRTAWVLAAGVAAVALGAAAVGAVALLVRGGRPSGGWAAGNSYLTLDVSEGDMPEEPSSGLQRLSSRSRPPSVRALVEAVDRAGRDPPSRGSCCAWARSTRAGPASRSCATRSCASAAAGKPSWAHLESGGQPGVLCSPRAARRSPPRRRPMLDVSGLAAEVTVLPGHARQAGRRGPVRGGGQVQERPEPVHGERVHRRRTASRWRRSSTASSSSTCGAWPRAAASSPRPCGRSSTAGPSPPPRRRKAASSTSCSTATRSRTASRARAASTPRTT